MTEPLKFSTKPRLRNPVFVVCWEADAGQLGTKVGDYLRQELDSQVFCEIDPVDFFPLGGVAIENDIVNFPESNFYAAPDHDLVIFYSVIPRYEWFRFFNLMLDVMREYRARELFTIGGMIALGAHTAPRDCWATFNSQQIKRTLAPFELSREMDFETPPGGRPTLNSFLLWTAKQRDINGANLWVPIPFYLVGHDDPKGQRRVLEILDDRLNLRLNYARIDAEINRQEERLARLRREQPDIDRVIKKLESNIRLTETEQEKLVKEVDDCLKRV